MLQAQRGFTHTRACRMIERENIFECEVGFLRRDLESRSDQLAQLQKTDLILTEQAVCLLVRGVYRRGV